MSSQSLICAIALQEAFGADGSGAEADIPYRLERPMVGAGLHLAETASNQVFPVDFLTTFSRTWMSGSLSPCRVPPPGHGIPSTIPPHPLAVLQGRL